MILPTSYFVLKVIKTHPDYPRLQLGHYVRIIGSQPASTMFFARAAIQDTYHAAETLYDFIAPRCPGVGFKIIEYREVA